MIKVGCINIDTSHPGSFGSYMQQGERMRYTALYNDGFRTDEMVEAFMQKFNVATRCHSLGELADKVDVGFVHSCNWSKNLKLAMPLIKKGKPVFIDKPFVGSLTDCLELERLAAQGARIFGSSSLRYCREVREFMAKPEEERGRIMTVFGTVGSDEFNYAVHIVELFGALLGTGAQSCRFVGRARMQESVCEHFFVQFAGGATAIYNIAPGRGHPFEVVIMTTKTTFQFRVDAKQLYGALVDRICDAMENNEACLAPVPALTESVKIMLAGRISRERGGAEIKLSEIPTDDPGFDGAAFERAYAERSLKR